MATAAAWAATGWTPNVCKPATGAIGWAGTAEVAGWPTKVTGTTGIAGAIGTPATGPAGRAAAVPLAGWLALSSAELVDAAVAMAVPPLCETVPTDCTFSSAEPSAALAG